jgi:hypothetical protein
MKGSERKQEVERRKELGVSVSVSEDALVRRIK